jgi:xylulokinase
LFELPEGIPVAVGSLDHHVAAIGAGAGRIAPFSISMGTVIAATCLDDNFAVDPKCCLGPGMYGRGWYRLAWHNHGTRALNWYHDNFAPEHSISELLAMAEEVPAGISLPALALCPWDQHWPHRKHLAFSDHHARPDHGIYIQSILAGIADLLKDMLNTLQPDLVKQGIVVTGGGARCDSWMRMISERIGAPVFRSSSEQAGCLGAAVLASVAAGWYSRIDEASAAMVGECVTL